MAGSLFWEGNKMDPQDLCQELRVYIKKDPIAEVHLCRDKCWLSTRVLCWPGSAQGKQGYCCV
jgi:hypothetical protein